MENTALLESLARGGDAHNVLGCFPTLTDQRMRERYTPMWDLNIAVWSPAMVARAMNDAQTDANQIRQLAARGMVTSPGGGMLGSANFVVNCPVLGFADTPPTEDQAPRPSPNDPPVEGAPVLFAQTGVHMGGELLSYWRTHGGLAVFGYPISPEQEVNGKAVQWLERARFEINMDQTAPYNVLLGNLGVEALERQGRDWQALPKAAPATPHSFSETGHAIAPEFWSYWSTHGLEFDQQNGKSMAESVALFGFPISEPQMETNANGDTVMTQWFERARFEYHPNNPEPYNVLLGRLGAELAPR